MKTVKVYTKDFCPYCTRAKALLDHKKVPYEEIDITNSPDVAAELFTKSGFRTVPQIFIGDQCIGGFDNMNDLDRKGELDKLLAS